MKIQLLNFGLPEKWLPSRKHYNDAGADVYAQQGYMLRPGETLKIPLGFGIKLPDGYMGLIYPRSSQAAQEIDMPLPPIDSGYTGEVHAILTNHNQETPLVINEGDRIGQLVIMPITLVDFVSELGNERGAGGFGSTGA